MYTYNPICVLEIYLRLTIVFAPTISKQPILNFFSILIGIKETALSIALLELVESEYSNKIKENSSNSLFRLKDFHIETPIFLIVVSISKVGSFLNRFSTIWLPV